MKGGAADSRRGFERTQSIREAVALIILACFSLSLLAAVVATGAPRLWAAAALAALVPVAVAVHAVRAHRRAETASLSWTAIASLGAVAVAGGLFTSRLGGLSGIGIGVLVASWAPAAWLVPRQPWALSIGLAAHAATFAGVARAAGAPGSVSFAQLALIAAGIVVVAGARLDFTRRTREDEAAWEKLEATQRELEIRRAELVASSAGLNRAAREQLEEALSHARTTEQLDRLLAERVAGRSRQLAEHVDRRPERATLVLAPGMPCGRAQVVGRMTPAPYPDCYLVAEPATRSKHLVAAVFATSNAGALADRLGRVLLGDSARHPAIAGFVEVVPLDAHNVVVVSEHRPGRLLSHVMARPDLGWHDAVELGRAIAVALSRAHDASIFHLGLDPYRINVGSVRHGLSRYGIGFASAWQVAGGSASRLAQIAARPAYRAPECTAEVLGTAAADVYALGVLLFEMIAKLHPVVARVDEGGKSAVRALLEIQPSLDPACAELVGVMLSSEPSQRPAMHEVAARLARLATAHGVPGEAIICARLNGSSIVTTRAEGPR